MLGRVYSHASSSPLLPGCDKQASPRMKHEFVSIMACPDWFFSMLSMYKSCWGRASRCFQCEKPRLPVDFLVSTAIGSRMDKIGTWFNFLDTSKTSLWVNKNEKNMTENGGSMSFNLQYRYWRPCYSKSPKNEDLAPAGVVMKWVTRPRSWCPLRLRVNVEKNLSHRIHVWYIC